MSGVAGLQRDRTAVASAAQTEGDRRRGDEPDDRRPAVDHIGELVAGDRFVGDQVAQPHHGESAEQGGEVDAVGDLEPLQLAQPAGSPGAPHLPQRDRRRRHRPATLTARSLRSPATQAASLRSVPGSQAASLRSGRAAGRVVAFAATHTWRRVGRGDAGVHGAARDGGRRAGDLRHDRTAGRQPIRGDPGDR